MAIIIANSLLFHCRDGKSSIFFQQIYDLSGYPEFVKKHGLSYSYQLAPRAEIFRRDQGKVVKFVK